MENCDNQILLGVNIDHVATLREVRATEYPNLVEAALLAEKAGADGITIHLREDRRHIQDKDVFNISENITTRLNLEMAVTEEMISIAGRVLPAYCCFVPERREELTTEGGLNVKAQIQQVSEAIDNLEAKGVKCSLFIDPDIEQINSACDAGANIVEIHTGAYAEADNEKDKAQELKRISKAVYHACARDIQVNAGHGLNYTNVGDIAAIEEVRELNIGHAIVCRALFVGIENAVSQMKRLMNEARTNRA